MTKESRKYVLSPSAVDEISSEFYSFLEKNGCERKDILRLRLALEDILV